MPSRMTVRMNSVRISWLVPLALYADEASKSEPIRLFSATAKSLT